MINSLKLLQGSSLIEPFSIDQGDLKTRTDIMDVIQDIVSDELCEITPTGQDIHYSHYHHLCHHDNTSVKGFTTSMDLKLDIKM